MKNKPYIGVTGFTKKSQIQDVLDVGVFSEITSHKFMAGLLISQKTWKGLPNKFPKRYPSKENQRSIFIDDPNCLNIVHYNTKEKKTLDSQLLEIEECFGRELHGFQLNIKWPSPQTLEKFRKESSATLVLQINRDAFDEIDNDPKKLIQKISSEYADLVDFILLDPSMGEAKEMDFDKSRGYISEFYNSGLYSKLNLAVAGGLSAEVLKKHHLFFLEYRQLSIDAEGKMRNPDNDELDIDQVMRYLGMANVLMQYGRRF